jgi:tRNA pseudouridine55 synthase
VEEMKTDQLQEGDIKQALKKLTGSLLQEPPMYSAKKVNGVPLYKRARRNEVVERQKNAVTIYEVYLIDWQNPVARIQMKVSRGTYVRAYAHDIGRELGNRAYVSALRRTQIGRYEVQNSFTINQFMDYWKNLN